MKQAGIRIGTHAIALALGFALGIYALPILTAERVRAKPSCVPSPIAPFTPGASSGASRAAIRCTGPTASCPSRARRSRSRARRAGARLQALSRAGVRRVEGGVSRGEAACAARRRAEDVRRFRRAARGGRRHRCVHDRRDLVRAVFAIHRGGAVSVMRAGRGSPVARAARRAADRRGRGGERAADRRQAPVRPALGRSRT